MTTQTVATQSLDFLVRRDDFHTCKLAPALIEPQPDQVLLRIDKFALTSNNITYAAFGDAMSYWNFFPAPEGWGRIPVWGFADVLQSRHAAIKPGERFYGYFPMSNHVVLQPERPSDAGFIDGAPHRKPLHAVYNQYTRTTADPGYDAGREAEQMLLRPLFITSFLIDDFLADNDYFGARAVVFSSASSKTAYGTAFLLSLRKTVEIIGLTSPGNAAFTERLGCYSRVVAYDQAHALPTDLPVVYVDMAGSRDVRSAVHHHFRENLKYSCAVGGTHWNALDGGASDTGAKLPGPRPTLFFAPAQIKKRSVDRGAGGLQTRLAEAWRQFMVPVSDPARGWLRVIEDRGPTAVERVYREVLAGRAKPDEGHILSLL